LNKSSQINKSISVVVPVLNEMESLPARLAYFSELSAAGCEVIFVDGQSRDQSAAYIASQGFACVSACKGRASQMNLGAEQSMGDVIIFHHLDSTIPLSSLPKLRQSNFRWGAFAIELDDPGLIYRWVGLGINFRTRLTGLATGDQSLFMQRDFFRELNGYAAIDLMEDVEFSRRARKRAKLFLIGQKARTSARRWRKNGPLRTILLMWYLQLLFRLGVSPTYIHRRYY
jgi:rSAM/selenodomain-associated transferase 2